MGEKLSKAAQDLLDHIRSQEIQTDYKLSLDDRFVTKQQLLKKNTLKALQELMEAGHIFYTVSQERYWASTRSGHWGPNRAVKKNRDVVLVTLLAQDET